MCNEHCQAAGKGGYIVKSLQKYLYWFLLLDFSMWNESFSFFPSFICSLLFFFFFFPVSSHISSCNNLVFLIFVLNDLTSIYPVSEVYLASYNFSLGWSCVILRWMNYNVENGTIIIFISSNSPLSCCLVINLLEVHYQHENRFFNIGHCCSVDHQV